MISHRVFEDPGLAAVFKTFYAPNPDGQWAQGESMITLLATVEDYLDDIETWLSADVSGSVTETLFEHLIELLFDVFTRHVSPSRRHGVASRGGRKRPLGVHDHSHGRKQSPRSNRQASKPPSPRLRRRLRRLCPRIRPPSRQLAEAGLDVVAAILRARRDMDKSTTRALIDRCRDVCITKLAAITGQRPSVGFSSASRTPLFRVAPLLARSQTPRVRSQFRLVQRPIPRFRLARAPITTPPFHVPPFHRSARPRPSLPAAA